MARPGLRAVGTLKREPMSGSREQRQGQERGGSFRIFLFTEDLMGCGNLLGPGATGARAKDAAEIKGGRKCPHPGGSREVVGGR